MRPVRIDTDLHQAARLAVAMAPVDGERTTVQQLINQWLRESKSAREWLARVKKHRGPRKARPHRE